jgi:hypothetical protein
MEFVVSRHRVCLVLNRRSLGWSYPTKINHKKAILSVLDNLSTDHENRCPPRYEQAVQKLMAFHLKESAVLPKRHTRQ